jgi:hypothetical protein
MRLPSFEYPNWLCAWFEVPAGARNELDDPANAPDQIQNHAVRDGHTCDSDAKR